MMMNAPRDLRLLAGATLISAAGDMLLIVVLALHVHELTASGFAVAALFAALMGPIVLLAPLAGRLVDRTETRRLLLIVSVIQTAVAAGLVFADGLASIIVLAALLGAGTAVANPAEAALVPATVDDDAGLKQANGWIETARYAGFTAGPLLAGALTAAGGIRLGLAVNAASFVAVALAAAFMKARREPGRGDADAGAAVASAAEAGGLRLLFGDPVLRAAIGAAVAALAFISASIAVEVFYVRDVVGAGPAGYALVMAAWTAGMVTGAAGLAARVRGPVAVLALIALIVQGAGMAVSALWPVLAWAAGFYLIGGIGHGVKNVLMRTLIQTRVPADGHGRAFATYNAARNTAELGALGLGGVLVAAIGAQPAIVLAGLGPVVFGAIGILALGHRPKRIALPVRPAFAASGGSGRRGS
jgi:MFS family permease